MELYLEDIDNVCRLCLVRSHDNIKIFSAIGESYKLQEKLYKQFNFWVKPEERIPKTVCQSCWSQVESFHKYALEVEAVQRRLQIPLKNGLTPALTEEEHCSINVSNLKRDNHVTSSSTSSHCSSGSAGNGFPPDYDEGLGLIYNHFREPMSATTAADYSFQTQLVQLPLRNISIRSNRASTSKFELASTEIEVEVDPTVLQRYGDQSNDTEYDEDRLFSKQSEKKVPKDNTNAILDVTKSDQLMDDDRSVNTNESDLEWYEDSNVNETSHKRKNSYVEDTDQSNDSDVDISENTKNSLSKAEQEEFVNRTLRWSKKRPFTKEHVDRSRKSKKIREQLDTFFDYVCIDCKDQIKFSNFLLLRNHCRDVHNKKAYVTCCKRKLTDRKALIHHMLTQHLQPDEFSCPQCGKSVSTQHMLKLHIINHLPESQRPYKCSQCGKGFCSIAYVRKHEKSHHFTDEPSGTFICDECGKSFMYERKLYVHKRNLHTKVENPVMCHICAKTFKHQSALRSHLMTHKEGRTEECPYCHKFFKNTDTVRSHIKQEHRVSPAHCDLCDKTFRSKRKLVCHTKVFHSNEKPYQCNICSKYFKLKSGLKTHLVQHTGEKPYQCPYCARTFASSGNWSTHKKRMHGEVKSVSSYEPQVPRE